jgi:hypothetical protein
MTFISVNVCYIIVTKTTIYVYMGNSAFVSSENMIDKINNERRRSMNAPPHDPATKTCVKEPKMTPYESRTGRKGEHGLAYHINDK